MQEHRISIPLGVEGLRVVSCGESVRGFEVHVETTSSAGLCPECQAVTLVPKERPVVIVRDLPIRGMPTYLVWRKRRYSCPACDRTFTESQAEIPPRARVTRRYERYLYAQVAAGSPVARVARQEAATFYRVQKAFSDGAQSELTRRAAPRPRVLGIDEAAHRKGQDYNTVVTDPAAGCVLEVLRGRDGSALKAWLLALPAEVRTEIAAVAIDMWAPYLREVRAGLPHAAVVCDKFHVIRTTGKALDHVRRRLQPDMWGEGPSRLRLADLGLDTRLRSHSMIGVCSFHGDLLFEWTGLRHEQPPRVSRCTATSGEQRCSLRGLATKSADPGPLPR